MMRDVKFRGKPLCERGGDICGCGYGNWVYGNLFVDGEDAFIAVESKDISRPFDLVQVTPETIGQFTGLCDKKETAIYEGDIVNYYGKTDAMHFGICTAEVRFDNDRCCFTPMSWWVTQTGHDALEVIGNKWDAPGLAHAKN